MRHSTPVGYGVIAKNDITSSNIVQKYLKGFVQSDLKQKQWFSQITDKNGVKKPLVGTISFINHGCEEHSNVKLQWVGKESCHVVLLNNVLKGEEVLCLSPNKYGFICFKCKETDKLNNKKRQPRRRIGQNKKRKKR